MTMLTSTDSYVSHERRIFTVKGVSGLDPRTLLDQTITLDGYVVRVVAVETYAVPDATGRPFGVVVTA